MPEQTRKSILDRALGNLRNAWQTIAGSEYGAAEASLRPDLPKEDMERLRQQMNACLERRGGEVSARARAAALGRAYLALDATGRERFLRLLAEDYDVDHPGVDAAIGAVRRADGDGARRAAERALREILEPPRVKLLTQFNDLPDGVKFLVDMRAELLSLAKKDPVFKALEYDLKALLAGWFDVGFLSLSRITWDSSPAALLEKLIAYEAVHAIRSWDDLKNRLASDRRCFAYFHPRMPDEPLIFVEVALVDGMAGNVQDLLDESAPLLDPGRADTAIFYSISNAQRGLAGISFGNFLIKRVVDSLRKELPAVKTFATLSPIPGFRRWLDGAITNGVSGFLLPAERKLLKTLDGGSGGAKGALKDLLASETWHQDQRIEDILRPLLMRLCAQYLVTEKRPGAVTPLDPVAHFHLSNGARMERLNWMGDRSEKGLGHAAGMMINYLYDLGKIDANHETYTATGKVAVSTTIKALKRG
jgi:malonyl-CoA decarboxylase